MEVASDIAALATPPPELPGDTLRDVESSMEQLQPRGPLPEISNLPQYDYIAPTDYSDETGANMVKLQAQLRKEAGL